MSEMWFEDLWVQREKNIRVHTMIKFIPAWEFYKNI